MATDNVLEATARAITYYLDVSQECTRRIVAVEGTLRAICNRLLVIEVDNKTSIDLAEQCIKSLELICARESAAVFEAGGLNCILQFILEHGKLIHKDTLHSSVSVVTRLCGKMEPNDTSLAFCVETLSELLKHEDNLVADGALRCFASLSDRFTRKGVDPAPLAKCGLVEELIRKLGDSILLSNTNKWSQQQQQLGQNSGAVAGEQQQQLNASSRSTVVSISTLTGLLSTLCRNSNQITQEILSSNILDSIEKAMYGDERCVLDTMRFLDLLLTLIFEGRDALPKTTIALSKAATSLVGTSAESKQGCRATKRADQANEKLYRQLIEWIRVKDTESLIEALETNPVDMNFMDDVGQTLLNWAAAFGTAEMCEYLASKGADVNRGQRSSSLHYAACFGRANIVKILLRHGANPDLRDEEGKTPLDKARERGEENHREVVQILQSPNDYVAPGPPPAQPQQQPEQAQDFAANTSGQLIEALDSETLGMIDAEQQLDGIHLTASIANLNEIKLNYTRRLMPIFCKVFLNCMIQSINKSCLSLLRKLINCASREQLNYILQLSVVDSSGHEAEPTDSFKESTTISTLLVELISKVLQDSQNYETVFIGLSISNDLFPKCSPFILEEFTRLGVGHLISQLAADTMPLEFASEELSVSNTDEMSPQQSSDTKAEDSNENQVEKYFYLQYFVNFQLTSEELKGLVGAVGLFIKSICNKIFNGKIMQGILLFNKGLV